MALYTYRCVDAPVGIQVKTEKARKLAVIAYEDIINREAANGWEYVGMNEYMTSVAPGCFSMGKPPAAHKMLVFRKPAE